MFCGGAGGKSHLLFYSMRLEFTCVTHNEMSDLHPCRYPVGYILRLTSHEEHERRIGNAAIAVILDVTSAIDRESWVHVLKSLFRLRARGRVLRCVKNSLSNRLMHVHIDDNDGGCIPCITVYHRDVHRAVLSSMPSLLAFQIFLH